MTTSKNVARGAFGGRLLPRASAQFWAICLLLAACFALGGSARGDVASLIVLRPLAILLLGFGLSRLQLAQVRAHRLLFAMALAMIALPALQLIPLPPWLWHQLPGRGLVIEIDRVASLGQVWRPLSLTPPETRNALYATLVPFAALVLGVQLASAELYRLLPVVLLLGGISATIGLLQTLGDPLGPLYFYATTNNGTAVGLFANRNHQGVLLAMMLPLLAVWGSSQFERVGRIQPVPIVAILAALCLLPLLLITGSRVGLICGAVGLLALPALVSRSTGAPYGSGNRGQANLWQSRRLWVLGGIGLLAVGLVALTIWLGRGAAWDRLVATGSSADLRVQILPTLLSMISTYFLFGTGMGSFERIYQVYEPDALLSPIYMNHAHNDWLELLLTGGLPAAILLAGAVIAFAWKVLRAASFNPPPARAAGYELLGLLLIFLLSVASISDYPLRVPSLAVLFTLAVLWSSGAVPNSNSTDTKP